MNEPLILCIILTLYNNRLWKSERSKRFMETEIQMCAMWESCEVSTGHSFRKTIHLRHDNKVCSSVLCPSSYRSRSDDRGYKPIFLPSKTRTHYILKNLIYFTSFSSVWNGQNFRNYREQFHHHLRSTPSNASPGTPQPSPYYWYLSKTPTVGAWVNPNTRSLLSWILR